MGSALADALDSRSMDVCIYDRLMDVNYSTIDKMLHT